MANPLRGEVALPVAEGDLVMRLTLGSLAALEARLGATGLVGVAERFDEGRYSAEDLIALLAAGLRGAGREISEDEVARLAFRGGALAAAEAAAQLLDKTFRGT